MAPPIKKDAKRDKFTMRVSQKTMNRIRILARLYAGGNVSKWITYAALEAPRKKLR